MDSTSKATTVNDNTNISCSKDQIINSPTLHILDDIENINETNTPASCVSSNNEIVLKLDEPVEQSVEEDLAEEFKLLKSPVNESNFEMESQSKLTEIECNMHSDNTVGQVDFDSSHLSGIKIVELESGNYEDILATVNSEKQGIKKTLKDPNAMLEIPTYIDNSNSDCEMSNDYFYMCAKENDSDSAIDTKDLNLEPENPENQSNFENDVMKLLKNEEKILTTDFENRIKNESNIDLCQSPESKERLPNDVLILIDPEEPDIINITEDDNILESTPNMASTESVVSNNEELSNALKDLDTDLNSSCNIISSQNSDASEDRLTSDTEGLTQSDISFMSDIVLVHDPDKETKCEDTDLLLPCKDIEISIDPNKVTSTIFTETKSIRPQLTAKDIAKEITLSVSETKPSIDPSKCTNIDSVSTISKINQDICTTNSNDCISLNNLAEKCIHSTSEISQQHIIDDTMISTSEINNQTNISHSGTPTKLSCHIEDNSKVLISKLENSKTILTQNPRDDLLEKKNNMKDPLLPKEIKIIDDAILPQQNLEKENVLSPSKDHKIQTKQDNIIPNTSKDAETSNSEISMIIEDNEVVNALTNISKDLKGRNVPQNNILTEETIKSDVTMTSTSKKVIPEISQPVKDQIQPVQENQEPIASTSKTDEDGQNTSDSLGLLAELSRIMEEEEDEEDNDDGENVDDEDEFDPDYESTNQMAAEQSEDSNTRHSEVEGKESKMNEKIADRPFEFNMEKDPVTIPQIQQQGESTADANENEDIDEMTVEAQDTIELKSDTSDIDDNKSKDLPEVKTDKSPSAITTDVVDLDSEDDIQETKDDSDVTSVNLPAGIDVIASHSSSANTDMRVKEGEIVISGIPKPTSVKVARLNTAEVSIKTTKLPTLEVFNLDSDDDMEVDKQAEDIPDVSDETIPMKSRKCMNEACPHLTNVFYVADSSAMSFYNAKKCRYVCDVCAEAVVRRNERLIEGIRNFEDLVLLDMGKDLKDSIEVLDSDSDDDVDPEDLAKEVVGEEGAKLLEVQLADIFNEQWKKYKMDARLLDSVDSLKNEMDELERQSKEVDDMLKQCQKSTDSLRNELYGTFKPEIKQLPPLTICDMSQVKVQEKHYMETRLAKRRLSSNVEISAKRKPDCGKTTKSENTSGLGDKLDDDNTDITVVQLSTENAPPDLPSVGELERPPLRVGMPVYAMKNMFGTWSKAHIIEVNGASNSPYSTCRIKFHKNQKNMFLSISARNLAYCEPANARLTIGTRAIALFQGSAESVKETKQREKYYSGIVAEVPNPVNNFRYLIFFDDGYAQYAKHADTRLVCEYSTQVWEDVHPFSRLFVKEYLFNYPQRPMVRLKANETIKTEWKDKWWPSKVVKVDASLVLVQFLMGESKARLEWIYRGSTRLEPLYREIQAAGRQRQRAMPRPQSLSRPNMPIVEYMRSDEQAKVTELQNIKDINNEELRRQRAVAKKSTAMPTPPPPPNPALVKLDSFHSRVVYYTPKKAVRPYKITPNHVCGPSCKRKDVLSLKDLLTYNPLAKPLLSGWERQIVRTKYDKRVMYRAPCGRRVRNMVELLCYLQVIKSDMGVDLFDFGPNTHCLAEFVINKYIVSKKDLANGKENVPVPCVNFYDSSLPEFCAYSTERTPTAGVPLNLDPEFLCGCDCEDDCEDKTKCACWKLTLEGAKTIGIEGEDVGYAYRRLPEPLRTGIYECNSRCKCKSTCLNRVVQHPLQLKLQVFKTPNRGWGIRALNDVPKGCFICIYVGNLLTDATANLDGLNEGDEYLAELDYIEVVEQTKEGFEEDVPDSIKALDKKESDTTSEGTDSPNEEEEEEEAMDPSEDEEFKPFAGYQLGVTQFNKRLRKRKKKEEDDQGKAKHEDTEKEGTGDGCITISDDEEVREPSRFTAAAGIGDGDFVPRHRSVRKLFGEDEACYIMDAKVQGNIGRYLNHSCCPNVFVQNVFVDTHDPRFPWVAFFASSHIKAGKELTWNYNYDIGSVPGKVLYCYCGETNCRGRLL